MVVAEGAAVECSEILAGAGERGGGFGGRGRSKLDKAESMREGRAAPTIRIVIRKTKPTPRSERKSRLPTADEEGRIPSFGVGWSPAAGVSWSGFMRRHLGAKFRLKG